MTTVAPLTHRLTPLAPFPPPTFDRYWALATPVWLGAAVVAAFWSYEGLCMIASEPLHSIHSIEDEGCRWEAQLTREQRKMPVLCEMPITQVNALIFDRRRKRG